MIKYSKVNNQEGLEACPRCGSTDIQLELQNRLCKKCGCRTIKEDFQCHIEEVHDDDCPCFGDIVQHVLDCANCTCQRSAQPRAPRKD